MRPKTATGTKQAKQLKELGYALSMWKKDIKGNVRKYSTGPDSSSGGIGYFDSIEQVDAYIVDVNLVRSFYVY